ncbi:hypothetical protein H072_11094 [Dactylellina haptotyla CBS 200.50]|uniref:Uncharacterized protein n=1 Tax=Dactylellina haptotyla (strain CBS 200.50) TaxID=1284197 RepID=S8BJY5_DACHA|nr:hypothetical protein H072_11094 [Dactylellina haptotyla CBS 200.50]
MPPRKRSPSNSPAKSSETMAAKAGVKKQGQTPKFKSPLPGASAARTQDTNESPSEGSNAKKIEDPKTTDACACKSSKCTCKAEMSTQSATTTTGSSSEQNATWRKDIAGRHQLASPNDDLDRFRDLDFALYITPDGLFTGGFNYLDWQVSFTGTNPVAQIIPDKVIGHKWEARNIDADIYEPVELSTKKGTGRIAISKDFTVKSVFYGLLRDKHYCTAYKMPTPKLSEMGTVDMLIHLGLMGQR